MAAPKRVRFDLEVGEAEAGVRLDRLLRRLLPEMPLSAIHRMVRKGDVRRARGDGKAKASDRPVEGERLWLLLAPGDAEALKGRLAGGGVQACEAAAGAIPILYRDEHLLAFDKPAGVAAHPGSGHPLGTTVLGALYARYGRGTRKPSGLVPRGRWFIAPRCESGAVSSAGFVTRPALVGRLDRDTSGVQLAGVSPQGLRGLSALVRSRRVRKTYLALVRPSAAARAGGEGLPDEGLPDEGLINSPLVDTGGGRARMRVVARGTQGALASVTAYRVLARTSASSVEPGRGATLLEVRPRTGRRHQIRAHFASIGAPLAGDVRYGDRSWNRELAARATLARLFLHCARVSFLHPVAVGAAPATSARKLDIRSPLPPELARALEALGMSHVATGGAR